MFKWVVALVLAASMSLPALADGEYRRHRYYQPHYYIYLPPERHVIEVVQPPWSGNFIINGSRFTAKTPACWRWAAGEREQADEANEIEPAHGNLRTGG